MRHFSLIISFLIFMPLFVSAQGGNVIYQQNNRYLKNKEYTANQEQVWEFRQDNQLQSSVFESGTDDETVFTVNVLMNKKADSYLAIFNITQSGKTTQEVDELMNIKVSGFMKKLKEIGLKDEDVFIDIISLVPMYDYQVDKKLFSKTYTEVPAGFEMQKNIHIRFSDEKMTDKILTAAAENEIYDFIKLEYFVKNSQNIYPELRTAAIKQMKDKLESFKELGLNYDTVYRIVSEKSAVVYPIDRYHKYQAYTSTAIEPGKFDETTKLRKPVTMFYNMLPYHKYDVIINPEILEPAVQYTYSLKIKFINKEVPNKVKKQYFLITPEGVVKYINVE